MIWHYKTCHVILHYTIVIQSQVQKLLDKDAIFLFILPLYTTMMNFKLNNQDADFQLWFQTFNKSITLTVKELKPFSYVHIFSPPFLDVQN